MMSKHTKEKGDKEEDILKLKLKMESYQHVIFPVDCLGDNKCKVSSLLGWADTAGGCSSKRYCRERTVTASLDGINF